MKYTAYSGGSINKTYPFPRELLMITPEQLAASGTEHGHQSAIFCWSSLPEIRTKYPQLKYMYAIPNGFFGTAKSKATMKAEGLKAGVPDICLPFPRRLNMGKQLKYGLYIELKVPEKQRVNNPLAGCSDEQLEFIHFLVEENYAVTVCYGWEQARDCIVQYLEG